MIEPESRTDPGHAPSSCQQYLGTLYVTVPQSALPSEGGSLKAKSTWPDTAENTPTPDEKIAVPVHRTVAMSLIGLTMEAVMAPIGEYTNTDEGVAPSGPKVTVTEPLPVGAPERAPKKFPWTHVVVSE